MMKIWRHKVLELLHAAVEPASRPGCRRSGLKASFESNAHATTVSICGDSQTSSLLRGRLDRQGHALGLTRFHVVKMHFKILKIVCDRASGGDGVAVVGACGGGGGRRVHAEQIADGAGGAVAEEAEARRGGPPHALGVAHEA